LCKKVGHPLKSCFKLEDLVSSGKLQEFIEAQGFQ
jgi:hypothetical protein